MSPPARLLSVRLQGFKSFATRTAVEFGPGISAVVGPNGAGKSNLADALRWTFGEQGRALRSRRSEDIIFAGSEARPAVGMAEVTVAIDNADGFLPTAYGVVELGRRLFRSGENEYLLNGTRVRLRDLEELLDAAHLADNAFLFIGQGMVDQALALRPEERRPLFEEVAGVRRHDRRKRAAQERLLDAEVNLARVRDVIAELRPQARRLAGQARQQADRQEAARALAAGVAAAARSAWHETAGRLQEAQERRGAAQAAVDAAILELRAVDAVAIDLGETIEGQARRARAARGALDVARAESQAVRLEEARLLAQRDALERDRDRVRRERSTVEERIAAARRRLALPIPIPPGGSADELSALDANAAPADDERRGAKVRLAERRRALSEEDAASRTAIAAEEAARVTLDATLAALSDASAASSAAAAALDEGRRSLAAVAGRHDAAAERLRVAQAEATRLRERLAAIAERSRPASSASAPAGAEAVAEQLTVDADLRGAAEAALGAAAEGVIVGSEAVGRGPRAVTFVLRDVAGRAPAREEGAEARAAAAHEGGGDLGKAITSDPLGVGQRLLGRAVWVPDLAAALRVAPSLPAGWTVTTLAGDRLDASGVLAAVPGTTRLALGAERAAVESALAEAEAAAKDAAAALAAFEPDLATARRSVAVRQREAADLETERRARVQAEAAAARTHELAAREAAWARAQQERRRAEVARLEELLAGHEASGEDLTRQAEAWSAYRDAIRERQRLEGSLGGDLARLEAISVEEARADDGLAALATETERVARVLSGLDAQLAERETALHAIDLEEGGAHERLEAAERARRGARERLHAAEEEARASEVAELEGRMAFDAVRERLLVELAGLGPAGSAALGEPGGDDAPETGGELEGDALESALDTVAAAWSSADPPADVPTPGALAALRRRYHELGAVNPFAAEEHAEMSARLTTLEAQRDDLESAIAATRRLIADLERLITEQFEMTFRALEAAFTRRFGQLFGGGHAQIALTDPHDPAASGVEIIARPPGKKAQPLAMLSGGERALTAVALLFAMLEVRPVPFCVLDEVDAALDEANIGRFAAALRELAATIQFVVITHNRGTIEEADALYGVTIGDDAVSRVISLRLEPAS